MAVTQLVRSTQIKPGTAYRVVTNDVNGKLADLAITASRALASDANGLPVASAVTATELGYVSGVTSAIQTQINTLTYGLSWKTAARVATTVNMPVSDNAGTITVDKNDATYMPTGGKGIFVDGIELAVNDRVLVKSQTAGSEKQNGIYKVTVVGLKTSTDAVLVRAEDMNAWAEVPAATVFASVGTVNADLGFVCTSDAGGTLDTTPITFIQFSTFAAGITQLTGEVTAGPGSGSQSATVTNSAVIAKVLTGWTSGAGTVTNADSILAGMQKIDGNVGAKVSKAGDTMTGGLVINAASNQIELGGLGGLFATIISSTAPSAQDWVVTIPAPTAACNFLLSGQGSIVAADISASAAIAFTQLASLTSGYILVGNGSAAVGCAMSADATIASGGALTIASNFLKDSRVATREVPVGDIDGLNCVFTLAADIAPVGSEHVFLNGMLQNEGSSNDYTVATKVVTFNSVAATPSGVITYGTPGNGDTVVLTGLPNSGGTKTFTKAAAGSGTEFSTIEELQALIHALTDVNATEDDTDITITVVTKGTQMNSATVTGTGSYSALSITFSGGTTNAPTSGSVVLVSSHHA